ncbi:hypothetical protein IIY66_00610 [Candidatus Saccharibacteria bacterium]|nr:hypothetical protein [Candidatus Saccharibacteria bacterium]
MPLADNLTVIAKGTTTVTDEDINIYYGIKVDKDLPAGTYTGELEYTLSDTGFPLSLRTMQQMTSDICEAAYTPSGTETIVPTATLTDIRDNKTYEIAKLADGNCWMTQNLDLDLSTGTTLTPVDTDITEDWTPTRSTISFTGITVSGWDNSDTTPYSANPGDVYYYTSGTDENDIQYDSLAECEVAGYTDCSHYHAGNYYNWSAAVASNDSSAYVEEFSNANTSICPAGWRLPKSANAGSFIEGNERITMVNSYDNVLGEYFPYGPVGGYYNYLEGGFNIIRVAPLYLTRAGYVWPYPGVP